ncbi:MAG TPA: hypothetical protein VGE06_04085 [Flavisolibacter sp.]
MDVWPLLLEWQETLPVEQKESIRSRVSKALNQLLLHDFGALVQVLYRVDVPEAKVKTVLQQHPDTDAGDLLADLLLQRMEDKRKTFTSVPPPPAAPDEEKW